MARLVANGDSITYDSGSGADYASQSADLLGLTPVILAYNGKETSAMYTDYVAYAPDHNIMSIFGGINDVINNRTAASIKNNLLNTVIEAKNRGISTIVVMTIGPWKNYVGYTAPKEAICVDVNEYILYSLERASGVLIKTVDTRSYLSNDGETLAQAYDSGDHLHPNSAGQDRLREAFIECL